jgi:hypothetical protein
VARPEFRVRPEICASQVFLRVAGESAHPAQDPGNTPAGYQPAPNNW